MREIKIFLIDKGFEKPCLHYEIKTGGEYYLFINTKKHNRFLKEFIKKAKVLLEHEGIDSDTLRFVPIHYKKYLKEG